MAWKTKVVLAAVTAFGAGCSNSEPQAADGAQLFTDYCAPCHGAQGTGNTDIEAPSIGGLPEWYVQGQLVKFRDGLRGTH